MHIFFTGEKGLGKSTLVDAVLESWTGNAGGFRTRRVDSFDPGHWTVHLLPLAGRQEPAEDNLLFYCGRPEKDTVLRFDRLGCEALSGSSADLLVMDELGPHEAGAREFQKAVRYALDGDVPILGVLQQAECGFLKEISGHPKVCLIPVTMENREDLAGNIQEFITILRRKETL